MDANKNRLNAYKKVSEITDKKKAPEPLLKTVKASPSVKIVEKSPEKEPYDSKKDSVYRRVAKFLLLIGIDEAAKILPHLTQEQTEKIIPEIASIRSVDSDEAAVILAEFENLLQQSKTKDGGIDTAKSILVKAFGPERAEEMLQKAVPFVF